jgi:hypothetical protein
MWTRIEAEGATIFDRAGQILGQDIIDVISGVFDEGLSAPFLLSSRAHRESPAGKRPRESHGASASAMAVESMGYAWVTDSLVLLPGVLYLRTICYSQI